MQNVVKQKTGSNEPIFIPYFFSLSAKLVFLWFLNGGLSLPDSYACLHDHLVLFFSYYLSFFNIQFLNPNK